MQPAISLGSHHCPACTTCSWWALVWGRPGNKTLSFVLHTWIANYLRQSWNRFCRKHKSVLVMFMQMLTGASDQIFSRHLLLFFRIVLTRNVMLYICLDNGAENFHALYCFNVLICSRIFIAIFLLFCLLLLLWVRIWLCMICVILLVVTCCWLNQHGGKKTNENLLSCLLFQALK